MARNPELHALGKKLSKTTTARRRAESFGTSDDVKRLRAEESRIRASMRRICGCE